MLGLSEIRIHCHCPQRIEKEGGPKSANLQLLVCLETLKDIFKLTR
jgi:hypothetical protein